MSSSSGNSSAQLDKETKTMKIVLTTPTSSTFSIEVEYTIFANSNLATTTSEIGSAVIGYLNLVLSIVLGVASAAASVYAIVVGVRLAKANNPEERIEAKKKVIYTLAGVMIAIALIIIINAINANVGKWI